MVKMVKEDLQLVLLPLFLPPISWWAAARGRRVVLDIGRRYMPQTELHRCQIKTAAGTQLLIVPVKRESKYGSIASAQIDNRRDWSRPLRQSLRTAYGKAPFFIYYNDLIEQIQVCHRLVELNISLIQWICRTMGWSTPIVSESVSSYLGSNTDDHRLIGIRGLAPPEFRPAGYWQLFGSFAPNLSIVDALFHLGSELDTYLSQCQPYTANPSLQVLE